MTGVAMVQAIIEILVAGINGVATGIGSGLSTLAESIFLQTVEGTTSLSVFGTVTIVFAGISLALGLCRLVIKFITSLGATRRM